MSDRLRCEIPFCRRTFPPEGGVSEVICGRHWRTTSKRLRRAFALNRRRMNRMFESDPRLPKHIARHFRLWRWIKRQAIERAGGIG